MNSRKIVLASLGLASGIAIASISQQTKMIFLVFVAVAILLVCLWISKNKYKIVIVAAGVTIGFLLFSVNITLYHNADINQSTVEVVGVVTDKEGILRDCYVDGKRVDGDISIQTDYYEVKNNKKLVTGSKVRFECVLSDCFVDKDGMYVVDYKNGIRYFTDDIISEVELVEQTSANFDESARLYIKDMLSHYMRQDVFGVAYAMVVGDKNYMDEDILTAFQRVGIAHIFAVSGLHVGFIAMLVNAFVKKRKKIALFVTIAVVIIYAYICNFSPSVMRAMVMTFVLLLTKALGREPDFLSSVATAVGIILLVKPFYLFDAGFQMSVGAVLGIDLVTKSIERFVKNKKDWVKKICSSFAISFGATLGTLPFALQYFGTVAIWGIFANMLIIPVVSIVFMAILICLILPVLFWGFPAIGMVLSVITEATFIFEKMPVANILSLNMGIIAYYVILYLVSGHSLYTFAQKAIYVSICLVFICYSATAPLLPQQNTDIIVYDTYGRTFCVTVDGTKYIFSNMTNSDCKYVSMLAEGDVRLYVLDFEEFVAQNAVNLTSLEGVDSLVIKSLTNMDYFDDDFVMLNKNKIPVSRVKNEDNGDIKVSSLLYFTKTVAVTVEVKGYTFTYVPELTEFQKSYLLQNIEQSDAYFCENMAVEVKNRYPDSIVTTQNHIECEDIYTTYRCGNFTLKPISDKMIFVK